MWLKLLVTLFLLGTLGLLVARPILVGPNPQRQDKRAVKLAFSERALAFTGALILTLSGAGVGAIVLVRRANEEYRLLAMENMKSLIEGAITDHQKNVNTEPSE